MKQLRVALLLFLAPILLPFAVSAATASLSIGGRITGPGGSPAAGARVRLVPVVSSYETGRLELEGRPEPEPASSTQADRDGRFRLPAEPGIWKVVVEANGFVPLEHQLAPLVEDVELPAATLERDARLEVRIAGPDGKPLAGARVLAETDVQEGMFSRQPPWRPARRLGRTDEKGVAVLPRPAGEPLVLRAQAPGFALAERKGVRTGPASFRLAAGQVRRLLVQDAEGKAVPGVLVRLGEEGWPVGFTGESGGIALALDGREKVRVRLRSEDGRVNVAHVAPPSPQTPGTHTVRLPRPGVLTGKVVAAEDGRPLAGAVVWTPSDPGTHARSTADGTWRLSLSTDWESLPVQAAAAGRFAETAEAGSRNGSRQTPTLALPAKIAVAGLVVDEKGRGVAHAEITATLAPGSRPPRMSFYGSGGLTRSGETGRFRLASLAPGLPYNLRITRPGFAPTRAEVLPQEAGGASQSLRIVLRTGRSAFGKVLDQNNAPVAGAEVTLQPARPTDLMARAQRARETDPELFRGKADVSGRFELTHLPPGTYDLVARGRGFAPLTVPGLVIPGRAGTTDLGTVVLAPGVALQGVVTDLKGRPVKGAEVRVREVTDDLFAIISRLDDTAPPDAFTAADGSFRLEDRARGEKVDLAVRRPGFGPGTAPGIVVPTEEPVRIVLQPASRVAGRVTGSDGKPVAGAFVSLAEMVSSKMGGSSVLAIGRSLRAESDDEGAFVFEGVSPGPFEVMARAPRHQPVTLQGLEVAAGRDLAGLEVVLAQGGTVEGRVLSPSGQPVPGAEVAVQEASQGDFSFPRVQTRADGQGRYLLDGVPPGPRTITAAAEGFRRTARDLDVRPGDNALDFELEAGHEVSGRVVDDGGYPVSGVRLMLIAGFSFGDVPSAVSGADGSFRIQGVPDGTFRVSARKEGYTSPARETLTVAGSSVRGLEISLTTGSAIVGRLSGLPFDEFSRVRIEARGQPGRVDPDGAYRISGLPPGNYVVTASVPGTSRQTDGRVTLEPGAGDAHLDLRFGEGLTLSGTVLRNGSPWPRAGVSLSRSDAASPRFAETDHRGGFLFGGLEAGTYEIEVAVSRGGIHHRETLEITGDRNLRIELRTASISGRVVDAAGTGPLAGARVTLVPNGLPADIPTEVTTDSQGVFRLPEASEGTWKIQAVKEGYAPADRQVQVAGAPVDDLEIPLQATEGVVLEALLFTGRPPDRIRAAVLDRSGRVVAGGTYPTGENGLVRLADVPAGSWELHVESDQSASATVGVTSPGRVTRVVLPPGGDLRVKVPALAASGGRATLALTGLGGSALRQFEWDRLRTEWDVYLGTANLVRVPAGTWQVTVRAADGRTWTTTAAVTPGAVVEVNLE